MKPLLLASLALTAYYLLFTSPAIAVSSPIPTVSISQSPATPTVGTSPTVTSKPGFGAKDTDLNDKSTLFSVIALVAIGGLILFLTKPK